MKIGFFVQKTTPESLIHFEIAKYMIASARKVMPDVPIVQFTDYDSPIVEGVDMHIRIGGDLPMAVRRIEHHASCIGDWLFCDSDVIFQKDCRDVFDEPFDVALTDRVGTYMEGTEYAKQQPYNMGVTFSRNPEFWKMVGGRLMALPEQYQEWAGDQIIVCDLAEEQTTPFDIVVLSGANYNYPPKTVNDEGIKSASIIHLKGERKKFIPTIAKRLGL